MESTSQKKPVMTNLRLLLYVTLAEVTCLLVGYNLSVMSGAMLLLVDTFQLDILWQQLLVAASLVGAAVVLFPAGYLVHKFGRKKLILGASVIICIGSVISAASDGKEVLLFGRFITGIGMGIPPFVVPIYVSECAPAESRGRFGSLTQLMLNGGILLAGLIGSAFISVHSGWRYMFALPCVVGIVQFLAFLFAPETPRWLIDKGRVEEAQNVLSVIRGDKDSVQSELDDIQRAVAEDRQDKQAHESFVMIRVMKSSSVRRALVVAVILGMTFQGTGVAAIVAYGGTIIKMAGFPSDNAAWLATIPFAVQFVAAFFITCFADKLGRKVLYAGAHIGIAIAMIVLGLGFYLSSTKSPIVSSSIIETYSNGTKITDCQFKSCHDCINSVNNQCGFCFDVIEHATCVPVYDNGSAAGGRCLKTIQSNLTLETDVCPTQYTWIPVLGMSLFELAFGAGTGVIFIIISEIFPLWARSSCSSIATAAIWIVEVIASITFLSFAEAITIHGIFWLYGASAVFTVIFTCIFLPETRGKRLEDIEKVLRRQRSLL